jgi:6-phosphogluconolactonase
MMTPKPGGAIRILRATDPPEMAELAAGFMADLTRGAIRARGVALLCLSGGSTPGPSFDAFARSDLEWDRVHIFQVDERIAPAGHDARNLGALGRAFTETHATIHPMPVESPDAARAYTATMRHSAGDPIQFDLVQLGIGTDGHTASLFPGDPALGAAGDVVKTLTHAGWARLSITMPVINRARTVLWLASGTGKHAIIQRLIGGDRTIPAGMVARPNAVLIADGPCLDGDPPA